MEEVQINDDSVTVANKYAENNDTLKEKINRNPNIYGMLLLVKKHTRVWIWDALKIRAQILLLMSQVESLVMNIWRGMDHNFLFLMRHARDQEMASVRVHKDGGQIKRVQSLLENTLSNYQ